MGMRTRWEVIETRLLSDNWAELKTTRLRLTLSGGNVSEQWRETYDRGDGAVVLPYDPVRGHVLLVRQFRWPAAYVGAEPHLVEAAAGLLDRDEPEARIRVEAEEELGLKITDPRKVFELFMSPGSVTERLHFFIAGYSAGDAASGLAGVRDEGEETEVLDIPVQEALAMVADGRICDAKTVILLQYAVLHLVSEDLT